MSPRSGLRKLTCPTCSRTFNKAEHLIRHQRTHTGAKPYLCSWCGREFSRHDSLVRHQHRHKHVGSMDDTQQEPLPDPSRRTDEQQEFSLQSLQSPDDGPTEIGSLRNRLVEDGGSLPNQPVDDLFLQLTWPDSENLLQSILATDFSNWPSNIDLLPSATGHQPNDRILQNAPSPWLGIDTEHHAQRGSNAVRNVSQIISELSANVTLEAESTGLSTIFLDSCLHMFFDQFMNGFPICHRPTFVFRDWTHPLLLNAIAIGSLFVGQRINVAKGEVLWTLAHTAVATSWHTLILHHSANDPCNGAQLILTALLGQTYAMLSGNPKLRKTAQVFHSLGFYWARECDMYNVTQRFDPKQAFEANTNQSRDALWRLWAAEETQLRALLGHYVLDGQLTQFTGAPTCQRHASNPLRLPCSENLFFSTTPEEWLERLKIEQHLHVTFRDLFVILFSDAENSASLPDSLSMLSIRVLIEGLKSFVSDSNSIAGPVVGNPSNGAISQALGSLYQYILGCRNLSVSDQTELLLRWHAVSLDAASDSTALCRNLSSQYAVEDDVFGKIGRKGDFDLHEWANTSNARRALLHAIAIWDMLTQLPTGRARAIHIPNTIFSAATIYCAYLLVGTSTVHVPDTVLWATLMNIDLDAQQAVTNDSATLLSGYLRENTVSGKSQVRNLLYDSNIFLLHLRQLVQPWGICTSLENILQQWLLTCGC